MARPHKTEQMPIPPHYHWVRQEFRRFRDKLEAVMVRPARPMGLEIVDGKAALKIWEQELQRQARRLPSLLRAFSDTILARSQRPGHVQAQGALIRLEQEINRLLALHRQLWHQPLPAQMQEGQVLLSCCLEKIAADLQDLFSFFVESMAAWANGEQPGTSTCLWDKEISCRVELKAYNSWFQRLWPSSWQAMGARALPRFFRALLAGLEGRGAVLADLVS